MSKFDELDEARFRAEVAFTEARQRYDKRLRELHQEAKAKLDADPIGVAFYAAQDAQRKTYADWLKEKEDIHEAASLNRLVEKGFAVGDVVEEWMPKNYSEEGPFSKTGNKGVVQILRRGDHAVAFHRHDWVNIGDTIVRLLKKDGTLGKKVTKFKRQWVKEGTNHPNGPQQRHCAQCGKAFKIDGSGVATHAGPDGIDHDADADHVPYEEGRQ